MAHKLQSVSHPEDRLVLLTSGASPLLEVGGRTALDVAASRNLGTVVADYLEALSVTAAEQWLSQAPMNPRMREWVAGDLAFRRHLRTRHMAQLQALEVAGENSAASALADN